MTISKLLLAVICSLATFFPVSGQNVKWRQDATTWDESLSIKNRQLMKRYFITLLEYAGMRQVLMTLVAACVSLSMSAQTDYKGHFTRSLHDVMADVGRRWGVKFKYNVDTVGKRLSYADFRIRPYSLEETLDNICKYFDFNWWKQNDRLYKIKPYEYSRRHAEEGEKMLAYLQTLYTDKTQFEARRDSVRMEVRSLLQIDTYMDSLVHKKTVLGKVRRYDGYTVQDICIETLPGEHVYGFYGAKGQVCNVHLPKERHDFGVNKRNAVYEFFIKVFGLDCSKWDESKVTVSKAFGSNFSAKR